MRTVVSLPCNNIADFHAHQPTENPMPPHGSRKKCQQPASLIGPHRGGQTCSTMLGRVKQSPHERLSVMSEETPGQLHVTDCLVKDKTARYSS